MVKLFCVLFFTVFVLVAFGFFLGCELVDLFGCGCCLWLSCEFVLNVLWFCLLFCLF